MPTTIKMKRKAGPFVAGELAQAEWGLDITNSRWYYSSDGTTVTAVGETNASIGSLIAAATSKATPVDADSLGLSDSAASNVLKRLTWANLKATLKTYFDTLYVSITGLGANVATFLATPSSANLRAALTDETGTGAAVFANTPSLVTPDIGAATGTSLALTGAATVADDAYDATAWNGSTQVPTKNALRDKIESMGAGGSPGGSDTQVQFNDGGAFGGDAGLTYNKGTDTVSAFWINLTYLIASGLVKSELFSFGSSNWVQAFAPSDKILRLTDAAQTDFNMLQGGGGTSSYPAIKRSGAKWQARLADDSGHTAWEVADEAYDAANWNGSLEVPTKNAVRDKIEGLGSVYQIILTFTGTGNAVRATSPALVTPDIGAAIGTSLAVTGAVTSSGTAGIGYAAGAGGAVTQTGNKSNGVTLNKTCGEITMAGAALASATIVSFTLTNSTIAATDLLILNHVTTGTRGAYGLTANCAAGSATIYVRNNTAGSLSEAIVIRFAVVKAVAS